MIDLVPLGAGTRSALSRPGDDAEAIEAYPTLWRPGMCTPVRGDATTIFTAPLIMLGCGVIVLPATAATLTSPDPSLVADIELALALATPLARAVHGSAIGAHFAPVVFDLPQPSPASSLASVRRALDVVVPIHEAGPVDATDFDAALAEVADAAAVAAAIAVLAAGFARLRNPCELWLGVNDAGRPNLDSIPVLWVGKSEHGRVVGLLADHVD